MPKYLVTANADLRLLNEEINKWAREGYKPIMMQAVYAPPPQGLKEGITKVVVMFEHP